jgi:hypothetical protein
MASWVRDPHAAGAPISDALKRETSRRLMAHAQRLYASKDVRLDPAVSRFLLLHRCRREGPKKWTNASVPTAVLRSRSVERRLLRVQQREVRAVSVRIGQLLRHSRGGFDVGAVYLPRPEPVPPRKGGPPARVGLAMHCTRCRSHG